MPLKKAYSPSAPCLLFQFKPSLFPQTILSPPHLCQVSIPGQLCQGALGRLAFLHAFLCMLSRSGEPSSVLPRKSVGEKVVSSCRSPLSSEKPPSAVALSDCHPSFHPQCLLQACFRDHSSFVLGTFPTIFFSAVLNTLRDPSSSAPHSGQYSMADSSFLELQSMVSMASRPT